MWTLPCSTELNVTFLFQNVSFPIHPLDTVTSALQGPPDSSGNPTCVGAFQPITTDIQGFDIILGDAFLRNVYASYVPYPPMPSRPTDARFFYVLA